MKSKPITKNLVCFGEVLWDNLPSGPVPGGAPMNVAIRASSFGMNTVIVSKVGNDDAGKDLKKYLEEKNVETLLVQTDDNFATGKVDVSLDEKGVATYNIKHPVAWDKIKINELNKNAVQNCDAFAYGSLVCRDELSKSSLIHLLEITKGLKIFDVNLRAPFYDLQFIVELMKQSDFIKLNEEELLIIAQHLGYIETGEQLIINYLHKALNINYICVTKGEKGAILFIDKQFYQHPGFKVKVVDTVGSGDSFLAALIFKLLNGSTPETSIDFACKTGALVASEKGANAKINFDKRLQLNN